MITKKQWSNFCLDVFETLSVMRDVSIYGKRVDAVNLVDNTITTVKQGEGPTVYTYQESVRPHMDLQHLYGLVSVQCSMYELYEHKCNGWS